ncbi:MAG: acetate--CoA ligase family protein [Candidatus Eisenbacteria bacterium]|uniref:Acetate--CoA ligase family protein n=1 Tax=Eiseniibacteriota bacterium TaxID=2212470 RepID=A0A948RVU9_UNCEI|nr:acetate--CoA ligase family protein [Candidatus Eisenbacteria bacterium]
MELFHKMAASGRKQLLESEVYSLLDGLGITPAAHFTWHPSTDLIQLSKSPKTAAMEKALAALPGNQAVIKIQSPDILHKTEAGGIAVCPKDPKTVRSVGRAMWDHISKTSSTAALINLLIVEKVEFNRDLGHELLLGWRWDRAFGPTIVLGPGGLLTEWFDSVSGGSTLSIFSADTFDREAIRGRLLEHAAMKVFCSPSRLYKKPPIPIEPLLDLLEKLVPLGAAVDSADDGWSLAELEINPLVVTACGRILPLDGVARIDQQKPLPPARPLSKVKNLLYPKSAVVLGVSSKGLNPGRFILRNLIAGEGIENSKLYTLHPSEQEIDGIPCYPTVADLPEKVDMSVVSVPAEGAVEMIRDLTEQEKTESIILIPGGFNERGREDLADAIKQILRDSRRRPDKGPVMIGGNCLGIVSRDQYNTFFLPEYKLPYRGGRGKNLAVISQSGAYLVTFSSNFDGIIFPKANISYGNEMDLTAADLLEYYLEYEPEVRTLACYVEGFQPGDGRRYLRLARRLHEAGRTLILFKVGRTPLGAKAAQSHTASMAGDYKIAGTLLKAEGVVMAETLNEYEDAVQIFTLLEDRRPKGRKVGVISNAGFECSSVMDHFYDMEAAEFSNKTVKRIEEHLPDIAHCKNPVDATPMAATPAFLGAVEAMIEDGGVDALIVSAVPVTPALDTLAPHPGGGHPEDITQEKSYPQGLIRLFKKTNKPMVFTVDAGELYDPMVKMMQAAGLPVYRKIDRASRALAAFCRR